MPREGRSITCIPAVKKFAQTAADGQFEHKRRVAAYARVSTDIEEQLSSYAAQVDYYTNYIQSRQDWEFVKVYTDEGISGTNTKYREGFKQMIADALAGKIDLIVTKSVSRFARNTVDSLTAVRQLKEHGVEIFFEKEKRSILEKFVNDFSEFPPEQRLNKTLMVKLVNEIIIFSNSRVIVEMKNGMQITTQQ